MKRPKLRKASKRMSCSKRYKIQKKVREHNRKLRREAKKKGVSKRVKKDPGVPSSAPFKEEVLREAEQRRQQIEEEKQKKLEAKKEERAKKRQQDKEAAEKETQPKAKKARQEEAGKVRDPAKNSRQFVCSQINKVLDTADVVIEVLDARDPLGCRCPQLEEAVLQRDGNKKLLLLLNKVDLVPKANVEQWMTCLQREFPVVAFKASTQIHFNTVKERKRRLMASNPLPDLSRGAVCWGNTCLTDLLTDYAAKLPEDASLRVGVVGFPNVGKSSVINSLKGTLACNAGVKRGITRSMQEVHILKNVKFLDSPGVPVSPSNPPASVALRSLPGGEGGRREEEIVPQTVRTLLDQYDKTELMLQYNIPDYRSPLEFFTLLAKKRGYLQKGGVPDAASAASAFLDEVNGPKLRYHCKAPESRDLPPYLSAAAVTELHGCWDVSRLEKGNKETLRGVRFPSRGSSISFTSSGPTAGSLSADDDPVEPPAHQTEPTEPRADGGSGPQPQEAPRREDPSVHVQLPPVDTGPPTDDAYDFNTDFK